MYRISHFNAKTKGLIYKNVKLCKEENAITKLREKNSKLSNLVI